MTPAQLREELLVAKRSHDMIGGILATAQSLARGKELKRLLSDAEDITDDASNTTLAALVAFDEGTDSAKSNALSNMEACARSLNLCVFLFQEIRKIVPHDSESDVAIHSFSNIGIRIAESAEEAAWGAAEAMEKEVGHG